MADEEDVEERSDPLGIVTLKTMPTINAAKRMVNVVQVGGANNAYAIEERE